MIRQHNYPVQAVGQSVVVTEATVIHSFIIDNPTGQWLYIVDTQDYIQPGTMGFTNNLSNPSSSFIFQFVNPPSGGIAGSVTGGPIVVRTYEFAQPRNYGSNYTAATSADISGVTAILNNHTTLLTSIQGNTGVGGSLETDLSVMIANTNPIASGFNTSQFNVLAASATLLFTANPLSNQSILIYNNNATGVVYIGSTVAGLNATIANAFPINAGGYVGLAFKAGSGATVAARAGTVTVDVRMIIVPFS